MSNPARNLLKNKKQSVARKDRTYPLFLVGLGVILIFLIGAAIFLSTRSFYYSYFRFPTRLLGLVPEEVNLFVYTRADRNHLERLEAFCLLAVENRGGSADKCRVQSFFEYFSPKAADLLTEKTREIAAFSFLLQGEVRNVLIVDYYNPERVLHALRKSGGDLDSLRQGRQIFTLPQGSEPLFYAKEENYLIFSDSLTGLERILILNQRRDQSLAHSSLFKKLQNKLDRKAQIYIYRNDDDASPALIGLQGQENGLKVQSYFFQGGQEIARHDPSWLRFIPERTVAVLRSTDTPTQLLGEEVAQDPWKQAMPFLSFPEIEQELIRYDLPEQENLESLVEGDFEIIVTLGPNQEKQTSIVTNATPAVREKLNKISEKVNVIAGQVQAIEQKTTLPDNTQIVEYIRDPQANSVQKKEVAGIQVALVDLPGKREKCFIYGFVGDKVVVSNSQRAFAETVSSFRRKKDWQKLSFLAGQMQESRQWFYFDFVHFPALGSLPQFQGLKNFQGASKQDQEGEFMEIQLEI